MPLSMYQASIPVFIRNFNNLQHIIAKGQQFAQRSGMDETELLQLRLAPDMYPFVKQVQIVSDAAKGAAARLAGVEIPSFPDTESTVAELQERISKTVAFLNTITPQQLEGSEKREIHIKVPNREYHFTGMDYLQSFVLPNVFFHTSIAYGILRHKGVELGKTDYLGKETGQK